LPELTPEQVDKWQKYAVWFLICTRCGIKFIDENDEYGDLTEIA